MKEIKLISSGLLLICLCLLLCQGTPVSERRVRRQEDGHNSDEQSISDGNDDSSEASVSTPTSVENNATEPAICDDTNDNEDTADEQDQPTNCVCSLLPSPNTQSGKIPMREQQMEVRVVLTRTKEPYDQRNVMVNVPQGVDVVGTTSESQNETLGNDSTENLEETNGVRTGEIDSNAGDDWQRVFEDDFNQDGAVDGNKWNFDVGGNGWGNNELQYYTDNRLENAHCQDGQLLIEARREDFEGRQYTSARLKSTKAFLYGRLQIRAKLPSGRGSWSALWMLPESPAYGSKHWPDSGEIDIMEQVGFDPLKIISTVHTQANNHMKNNQPKASTDVSDATTQHQIYTLHWNADNIEMFVGADEATALETSIFKWEKGDKDWTQWPFDQPFYIIMNIAVGGSWGGQKGIDESSFPQQMEIDWVRFDQKK